MGFFKKSVPSEVKRSGLTIIAKGNKIAGEMVITGKLHIDGTVEGSITSIENVSIGKTGIILGKLKAKNVTVNGLLEGEVECDHLHITAGGKVKANVCSIDLTMEAQSHFFGESREKIPPQSTVNSADLTNYDGSISQLQHENKGDDLLDGLPNTVSSYEQRVDISVQQPTITEHETSADASAEPAIPESIEDVAEKSEQNYGPQLSYSIANEGQLSDLSFNSIVNQELAFVATTAADASFVEEEQSQAETASVPLDLDNQEQRVVNNTNTVSDVKTKKKSRTKTVDKNTTVMELKI